MHLIVFLAESYPTLSDPKISKKKKNKASAQVSCQKEHLTFQVFVDMLENLHNHK